MTTEEIELLHKMTILAARAAARQAHGACTLDEEAHIRIIKERLNFYAQEKKGGSQP